MQPYLYPRWRNEFVFVNIIISHINLRCSIQKMAGIRSIAINFTSVVHKFKIELCINNNPADWKKINGTLMELESIYQYLNWSETEVWLNWTVPVEFFLLYVFMQLCIEQLLYRINYKYYLLLPFFVVLILIGKVKGRWG